MRKSGRAPKPTEKLLEGKQQEKMKTVDDEEESVDAIAAGKGVQTHSYPHVHPHTPTTTPSPTHTPSHPRRFLPELEKSDSEVKKGGAKKGKSPKKGGPKQGVKDLDEKMDGVAKLVRNHDHDTQLPDPDVILTLILTLTSS